MGCGASSCGQSRTSKGKYGDSAVVERNAQQDLMKTSPTEEVDCSKFASSADCTKLCELHVQDTSKGVTKTFA